MEMKLLDANMEYYRAFYYVAKLGSMTAAADKLCLTQPTVTSAIRRLESQLGASLFIRTKKGVQLTHEGRILWNRVEPAMLLLLSGERELKEARELEGGLLRIVSTEMSCRTYILPTLEQFTRDYPKVNIRFRNALTENVLEMVRRGECDMAILHKPFPEYDDLELRFLDKIEECFVVGPRYSFLAEGEHGLEELLEYPMISMPEGASTKLYISSLFGRNGLSFRPGIEVTTIELEMQAVERNLGIGTLPVSEAAPRIKAGKMFRVPLKYPPLEREAYVITSRSIPLSAAAKVYLDDYLLWSK